MSDSWDAASEYGAPYATRTVRRTVTGDNPWEAPYEEVVTYMSDGTKQVHRVPMIVPPFVQVTQLRWVTQKGPTEYIVGDEIKETDVLKIIEADIKLEDDSGLTLQERAAKWIMRVTNEASRLIREAEEDA